MFAVVDNWIGITACLEELAHFLRFFTEITVVATKTPQSKELRVWESFALVPSNLSLEPTKRLA